MSSASPGLGDLIFISMENWDDVWRRNQFVCAGLSRRFPNLKILFVGLARDVSHSLRHGNLSGLTGAAAWNPPGCENITVIRPLKFLPNTLWLGRLLNNALMSVQVRLAAGRADIRNPILWLNPHYAVHMVHRMGEKGVVYDITDDWISLAQSPAATRLVEVQDAELCRRADAVIVCSRRLYELKQSKTQNLHLIPNGVDADHYLTVLDGRGSLPLPAASWPRPVLGYTGSIHSDRVDIPLIEAVARRMTSGSIVLIGPNFLSPSEMARLQQIGNVILPGPIPYHSLPDTMRAFDVCITPHCVTPFTESLNPIKLWEYLAAGKPIVSTDVAGFRDYPQFVHIAQDATTFIQAVERALHQDPAIGQASRLEAQRHSWNSRVEDIVTVLNSVAAGARKSAHA